MPETNLTDKNLNTAQKNLQESPSIKWGFGKRVPKTEKNKFGWENVELSDIPTDKPILLCFGGDGTTSNQFANFLAKMSFRLLGVKEEDEYIDTFSVRYSASEHTIVGRMNKKEIEELAKKVFIPRVTDKNGERLPVKKACENLRDINILIHCYGQDVVNETITHLANTMQHDLGYQEDEIRTALKQIFVIGYAPFDKSNNLYTSFFVKSLNDEIFDFSYKKDFFQDDPQHYVGVGELKAYKNTLNLFTDSMLGVKGRLTTPALFEHGNLNYLLRTTDWTSDNPRAETISRIMALALALGITGSKKQHAQNKFIPLPDAEDIKTFLQPEIENAKKTAFEKEDEKLWHEYKEKGVPFDDVVKYSSTSEKDLLNGKTESFDDVVSRIRKSHYRGIVFPKNSVFTNLGSTAKVVFKTKKGMADEIIPFVEDNKNLDVATAEYNLIESENLSRCILLPDGTYEEFAQESTPTDDKTWLDNALVTAKVRFIQTDNSVILHSVSGEKGKEIKVDIGKKFEDRDYDSPQEFLSSLTDSITGHFTLTKEQTRVIINIARAQDVPIQSIILDKSISLNDDVLESEIVTDQNGQMSPAENQNESTEQEDIINHFEKQKETKKIKSINSKDSEVSIS